MPDFAPVRAVARVAALEAAAQVYTGTSAPSTAVLAMADAYFAWLTKRPSSA